MNTDFYINLIYKKLSGEISAEETQSLDNWLEKSTENRHTLESINAAWEASGDIKPEITVDLEQEFGALDERILEEEKEANVQLLKPRSKTSSRFYWQIAAAILFLIGGFFLIRNTINSTEIVDLVELNTVDRIKEIVLPDGSKITLNKLSSLTYPKNFSGKHRTVSLNGEAFFDIIHDVNKPFIIKFEDQEVEVLGTSFNIKSTLEENTVSLISGKVKWSNSTNSEKHILKPGMVIHKDKKSGKVSIAQSGAINSLYWKDQLLKFDESDIKDVFKELALLFDVKFSEVPESLKNCTFSSEYKEPTLNAVLTDLSTVFGVVIKQISSKSFQLKGGECQ